MGLVIFAALLQTLLCIVLAQECTNGNCDEHYADSTHHIPSHLYLQSEKCRPGTIYCFVRRACVDLQSGECEPPLSNRPPQPPPNRPPRGGNSGRTCPEGSILCLTSRMCIDRRTGECTGRPQWTHLPDYPDYPDHGGWPDHGGHPDDGRPPYRPPYRPPTLRRLKCEKGFIFCLSSMTCIADLDIPVDKLVEIVQDNMRTGYMNNGDSENWSGMGDDRNNWNNGGNIDGSMPDWISHHGDSMPDWDGAGFTWPDFSNLGITLPPNFPDLPGFPDFSDLGGDGNFPDFGNLPGGSMPDFDTSSGNRGGPTRRRRRRDAPPRTADGGQLSPADDTTDIRGQSERDSRRGGYDSDNTDGGYNGQPYQTSDGNNRAGGSNRRSPNVGASLDWMLQEIASVIRDTSEDLCLPPNNPLHFPGVDVPWNDGDGDSDGAGDGSGNWAPWNNMGGGEGGRRQRCERGQIYCLQRRQCVPKSCLENQTPPDRDAVSVRCGEGNIVNFRPGITTQRNSGGSNTRFSLTPATTAGEIPILHQRTSANRWRNVSASDFDPTHPVRVIFNNQKEHGIRDYILTQYNENNEEMSQESIVLVQLYDRSDVTPSITRTNLHYPAMLVQEDHSVQFDLSSLFTVSAGSNNDVCPRRASSSDCTSNCQDGNCVDGLVCCATECGSMECVDPREQLSTSQFSDDLDTSDYRAQRCMDMYSSSLTSGGVPDQVNLFVETPTWPTRHEDIVGTLYMGEEAISPTGAVVPASAMLTYVPEKDYSGSAQLRVWSLSGSAIEQLRDASWSSRDEEAIHEYLRDEGTYDDLSIQVEPVNDAPVLRPEFHRALVSDFYSLMSPRTMSILEGADVPFDADTNPNYGFLTNDLARHYFVDPDDGDVELRLAVVIAKADQGHWEYQLSGGSWTRFDSLSQTQVTQSTSIRYARLLLCELRPQLCPATLMEDLQQSVTELGQLGDNLVLKIFPIGSKIHFLPNAQSSWSYQEAMTSTTFGFFAVDDTYDSSYDVLDYTLSAQIPCSLTQSTQTQNTQCALGGSGSFSAELLVGSVMRVGCDGEPGSGIRLDVCGECGGREECVDCGGEVNGNAYFDICGDCVGGSTGVLPEASVDCRGTCGGTWTDAEYGICLPDDEEAAAAILAREFCNGPEDQNAYINSCDLCVGGNTGLVHEASYDFCGQCLLHQMSCDKCDTTGTRKLDECQNCLAEDDPTFNDCVSVRQPDSLYAYYSTENTFRMTGNGMSAYAQVEVILESTEQQSDTQTTTSTMTHNTRTGSSRIVFTVQELPSPGEYTVVVYLNGHQTQDNLMEIRSSFVLTFFDLPTTTPNSISMQVDQLEDRTVAVSYGTDNTLAGATTLYIMCPANWKMVLRECRSAYIVEGARFLQVPSTYYEPTDVVGEFNILFSQMGEWLAVPSTLQFIFSPGEPDTFMTATSPSICNLRLTGAAPQLVQASFSDNLCSINIDFDVRIDAEGTPCDRQYVGTTTEDSTTQVDPCTAAIFNSQSVQALGNGVTTRIARSSIIVLLGDGATVQPGYSLSINHNVIKQQAVNPTYALYYNGVVTLAAPSDLHVPVINLRRHKDIIHACSDVTVGVHVTGGRGCMNPATVSWEIDFVPGQTISREAQSALSDANDLIQSETGTMMTIPGDMIEPGFTYVVTVNAVNSIGIDATPLEHVVEKTSLANEIQVSATGPTYLASALDSAFIHISIKKTSCANSIVTSVQYRYALNDVLDFSLDDARSKRLKINGKKVAMRGNTNYTISCTAIVVFSGGLIQEYTNEVTFYVDSVPPVANIHFQSTAGIADPIKIDASDSLDPDRSGAEINYFYECFDMSAQQEPSVSGDDNVDPVYDVCRGNYNGERVIVQDLLNAASGEKVTMPGGILTRGEYAICVTVAVEERRATACDVLTLMAETPATIRMDPYEPIFNPEDEELFTVEAMVCHPGRASMIEYAGVNQGGGYIDFDTMAPVTQRRLYKSAEDDCVIAPLALPAESFDLDSTYTFQIEALLTGEDGNPIVSSDGVVVGNSMLFDVSTVSKPVISSVVVDTLTGTALETMFTVRVEASDLHDLSLSYVFKYQDADDNVEKITRTPEPMVQTVLPEGEFRFMVRVCNELRACSTTMSERVTVTEIEALTPDVVNDLITDTINKGEVANILADLADDDTLPVAVQDAVIEAVNIGATEIIGQVSTNDIAESTRVVDDVIELVVSVRRGDSTISTVLAGPLADALLTIAGMVTNLLDTTEVRRRRDVELEDDIIDINRAISILRGYDGLFSGFSDEDINEQHSLNLQRTIDDELLHDLCSGLIQSGPPRVAEHGSVATVRADHLNFTSVPEDDLPMILPLLCDLDVCYDRDGGSNFIEIPSALMSEYSSWACDADVTCSGVCLSSVQFDRDFITASSSAPEPLLSTIRSKIAAAHMVNPRTLEYLVPADDAPSGLSLVFAITGTVDLNVAGLQCRQFKDGDWTSQHCTTSEPFTESGDGRSLIRCTCTENHYTGVFEIAPLTDGAILDALGTLLGDDIVDDIDNDIVGDWIRENQYPREDNATLLVPDNATSVWLQFRIIGSFSTIVGSGNQSRDFREHLTAELADALDIREEFIQNVELTEGSVIVLFELVRQSPENIGRTCDIEEATWLLQNLVSSGDLASHLTDLDGNQLVVDLNGFSYNAGYPDTVTKAPKKEDKDDKNMLWIIIGCSVGGFFLICIIVVVIVILYKNQQGDKKPAYNRPQSTISVSALKPGLGPDDAFEMPPPYQSPVPMKFDNSFGGAGFHNYGMDQSLKSSESAAQSLANFGSVSLDDGASTSQKSLNLNDQDSAKSLNVSRMDIQPEDERCRSSASLASVALPSRPSSSASGRVMSSSIGFNDDDGPLPLG